VVSNIHIIWKCFGAGWEGGGLHTGIWNYRPKSTQRSSKLQSNNLLC
jgi:hypothetical protein